MRPNETAASSSRELTAKTTCDAQYIARLKPAGKSARPVDFWPLSTDTFIDEVQVWVDWPLARSRIEDLGALCGQQPFFENKQKRFSHYHQRIDFKQVDLT